MKFYRILSALSKINSFDTKKHFFSPFCFHNTTTATTTNNFVRISRIVLWLSIFVLVCWRKDYCGSVNGMRSLWFLHIALIFRKLLKQLFSFFIKVGHLYSFRSHYCFMCSVCSLTCMRCCYIAYHRMMKMS